MNGIETPERKLKDLATPLRMINPESQKIGMPVIKPVIPTASGLLSFPVFDKINLAILIVAPDLSRARPMIAPNMIRKPIEAIVLPKPSFNAGSTFSAGMVVKARNTETPNKAMNACNLNFDVRRIIASILTITRIDITTMFTG